MLRSAIQDLSRLLGFTAKAALSEEAQRNAAEVEFLTRVLRLMSNSKGQVFATSQPGAQLTLVGISKPVEDPDSEKFEFIAPLIVKYEGTASPSVWAEAEQSMESRFLSAVQSTAVEMLGDSSKVRLVRRRKSDPFKSDPRSLTILRFRVT